MERGGLIEFKTCSVGKRMKRLMLVKDISARELAKTVGLTEVRINKLLRGERRISKTEAVNIATALDSTPEYILGVMYFEFAESSCIV